MIIGKKENISQFKGLSKRIDKAIEYILSFNNDIKDGTYEIEGKNIYANVFSTETASDEAFKFEAHKKYLDLQYIVSGSERMVYSHIDDVRQITEYDEKEDYLLLEGKGTKFELKENDFYLVYPFDAHAPALRFKDKNVRKVIVKIKIN